MTNEHNEPSNKPGFVVVQWELLAACNQLAWLIDFAIKSGEFHAESIYGHQLREYQAIYARNLVFSVPKEAIGFACPTLTPKDGKLTHILFPKLLMGWLASDHKTPAPENDHSGIAGSRGPFQGTPEASKN